MLSKHLYARNTIDGQIIIRSHELIELESLDNVQVAAMKLMTGEYTTNEIYKFLLSNGYEMDEEELSDLIETLQEYSLVVDQTEIDLNHIISDSSKERYARQISLFSGMTNGYKNAYEIQKKIESSHVAIVGLGGVGSYALYAFAAMGVGTITACDFDTVDLSNLSRQILYHEQDVGKKKVEVAKQRAKEINSQTKYHFFQRQITSTKDLTEIAQGSDIVLLAADTPRGKITHWMNEASYQLSIPFLTAGTSMTTQVCGPLIVPGKTLCFDCSMPEKTLETHPIVQFINQRYEGALIDPYNAIVASLGVLEIMKHLTGFSESRLYNHRYILDLHTLESSFVEIKPKTSRNRCPLCE